LTFPIRYHRPERRETRLLDWLCIAPALFLAGAMIGHLIEAVVR
jgi:hypothetical protein